MADQETKSIKCTRTVRRVPLRDRWSSENLQWVATVPWNKGNGDKEADGDMPEFDVKAGPGRNLTEEEKMDIMSREVPRIVHRAHLRKTDFEKHGFTDRCPGCSAILRGLNTQPHSQQCRGRMEKLLEQDIRIMNAKARLQERQRRHRESDGDEAAGQETKRLRFEEIENQAMNEENPDKLTKLFEDYRSEYIRGHPDDDGDRRRRRVQSGQGRDVASSSSVHPLAVEADEMDVNEVSIDYGESFDGWGEFAIDDITGAQLLLDLVRAADGRRCIIC